MNLTADHSTASSGTYRLSFWRVMRSEAIKTTTLRSTWWSIAVVAVASIGMSLLMAYAMTSQFTGEGDGEAITQDPLTAILGPTQLTVLLAGVIGAITVTGEYSTGMIRSTFAAEPRRGAVLAAKALVVGILLASISAAVFAISALLTAPLLAETPIAWSDPTESTIPILFGVLSMAAFSLLGLSFGFIIANGAGALAATVGVLFLLPPIVSLFPTGGAWQWIHDFGNTLPGTAAQALMVPGIEGGLSDGVAQVSLAAWVAVGLAGAWLALRSRDA